MLVIFFKNNGVIIEDFVGPFDDEDCAKAWLNRDGWQCGSDNIFCKTQLDGTRLQAFTSKLDDPT